MSKDKYHKIKFLKNSFQLNVTSQGFIHRPKMQKHSITNSSIINLVPRAHVSFGQRQDTELWSNPFQESKNLGPALLGLKHGV